MTEYVTQEQAIAAIPGLSHDRLAAFRDADLLLSLSPGNASVFRPVDLARLQLLCDLADHFDLEGDALGVVIGLIDQLHVARRHLYALAEAMEAEPLDLRERVGARFVGILAV
jgi:chaperone modulatory protein CbpM